MPLLERIDRHANLMFHMSEALRIDLADALIDGRLGPQALRAAVLRCTGCTHVAECRDWTTAHVGAAAKTAPGFCLNRGLLDRLSGT